MDREMLRGRFFGCNSSRCTHQASQKLQPIRILPAQSPSCRSKWPLLSQGTSEFSPLWSYWGSCRCSCLPQEHCLAYVCWALYLAESLTMKGVLHLEESASEIQTSDLYPGLTSCIVEVSRLKDTWDYKRIYGGPCAFLQPRCSNFDSNVCPKKSTLLQLPSFVCPPGECLAWH